MNGWQMSPDDEKALGMALSALSRKGLIQGQIDREDLRQEMVLALWKNPKDEVSHKVVQAKSAGIDYVRRILGRNGHKSRIAHTDDVPDVAGGDDPAKWAEVSEALEQAVAARAPKPEKPPRKRPVGAPDPKRLTKFCGPPPPPLAPPQSAWRKVYDSLEPGGDGFVVTEEQARSFASWGRANKCRVIRRRIESGEHVVWRPAL